MSEARKLTQAERCSLFLLDHKNNELIAKVFDGDIITAKAAAAAAGSTKKKSTKEDDVDESNGSGPSCSSSSSSRKSSKEKVREFYTALIILQYSFA